MLIENLVKSIAKIINQFYEVNQYYPKNILVLVDGPKTIPALEESVEEYLFSKAFQYEFSIFGCANNDIFCKSNQGCELF
jgi:hypothetical protein